MSAGEPRVLMLGAVNSPHVEHLAGAVHKRGYDVHVGGYASPAVPPSELPAAGIPVHLMPERALGRGGIPIHVRWLKRLLDEISPQLVHAHGVSLFGWAAALAGAQPLISTAWGSDVYGATRLERLQIRFALRRSTAATADSPDLLARMRELSAPAGATELIGWGVDLNMFSPARSQHRADLRERLGLGPGPMVLGPRALKPLYNPNTVLRAFSNVAATFPDAQLVLKHLDSRPPDLGDLDGYGTVHVVGSVPYERMADYYRAADVCVSIPSSDSAPRSVWEAMACGCPCVVSDLPWLHGVLAPGEDVVVVPIDADDVAAAIGRVLADGSLAAGLAERGRAFVESHEDQDVHMARLCSLYERVTRDERGLAA